MALINNLYVHVVSESLSRNAESTSHPVEKGLDITDTIRTQPITISISGSIVSVGETKASDILDKLKELQKSGSLITYKGRNVASNMQIQSFSTSHPNTIWGGCEFDMELKEVRIAKKAYTPTTSNTEAKVSSTKPIEAGDIVVFKGGNVYRSSDAKKAAATRGRSTCKVTIPGSNSSPINTRSWSIHDYHLVSTDGGKVYGWVDVENIEGATSTAKTAPTTKSGTQQTKTVNSSNTKNTNKSNTTTKTSTNKVQQPVYYTVKKGDRFIDVVYAYPEVTDKDSKRVMAINGNSKTLFKTRKYGDGSETVIASFADTAVGEKMLLGWKDK